MRRLTFALLMSMLLVPAPARAWGFEAHRFIVSRAIDLLPPEIRPFFEANRAFIVERAIDPDLWRIAGFADEPPRHFLDIDAYGEYPFKELPRDYDAALKKYGSDMLTRNGLLPWRTAEIAGSLIRGFQSVPKNGQYAYSDLRFFAAIIGHYAADAHVPLHAVVNYDGQLTGQRGIHNRFEDDLFIRYRDRLTLAPGPLKSIQNERDFIFDTLLDSSQLVPQVLAADKAAIGNGDVYDDRYFDAFFATMKPVLEKRMSDAITGVASLITSAWEQAGRPAIPAEPSRRAPQRRRTRTLNSLMDVYLIPVGLTGSNRYEMYCEDADDDPPDVGDLERAGWLSGTVQKFKTALARVEEERLNGPAEVDDGPKSWTERMKDRGLCWIAEKIAEQRLLWRLRKQTEARLFYPDDLDADAARRICFGELQREADRHLKWVIVDGVLLVASTPIALVPGPNVLADHFGFRLVGHYLSLRGAKHALAEVDWNPCANPELSQLRQAIGLAGYERERAVHEVASRLNLQHLAKFVERVAIQPA